MADLIDTEQRNFLRLSTGYPVELALGELMTNEALFHEIEVRQKFEGTAHDDTETIVLRGPSSLDDILNNLDAENYACFPRLRSLSELVLEVCSDMGAREIGRVMVVRLKAGGSIKFHRDEGKYARWYSRFHLPLLTNSQCLFQCGNEVVNMEVGDLWWFNHQVGHSVLNKGPARIHLIIDACVPGFNGALQ
jgi:hypothetical protein